MRGFVIAALLAVSVARASAAPDSDTDVKDEDHAIALSAGGTIVSVALIGGAIATGMNRQDGPAAVLGVAGAAGLVLAPSFGHWYAHDYLSTGLLLRVGGIVGGALLVEVLPCSPGDSGYQCGNTPGAKGYGLAAGAATVVAGVIWDVATASSSAREFNREHHLALAPAPVAGGYGFALAGRF